MLNRGGGTHHVAHLVRQVLKPALYALHARDHRREFRAHDRLRAERLAERPALGHPPAATARERR